MNVFQTDPNGIFVGIVAADPDPLDAGNWLIPAGCVTTAPPEIPKGHQAIWEDAQWRIAALPTPQAAVPEAAMPPDPDQIRAAAAMTKIDFCRALYVAKILTADLVVDAALGQWPSPFAAALAHLGEAERVDAKLAWAGAGAVGRMAPLFLSLLSFYANSRGMTPDQAQSFGDQIFGLVL